MRVSKQTALHPLVVFYVAPLFPTLFPFCIHRPSELSPFSYPLATSRPSPRRSPFPAALRDLAFSLCLFLFSCPARPPARLPPPYFLSLSLSFFLFFCLFLSTFLSLVLRVPRCTNATLARDANNTRRPDMYCTSDVTSEVTVVATRLQARPVTVTAVAVLFYCRRCNSHNCGHLSAPCPSISSRQSRK